MKKVILPTLITVQNTVEGDQLVSRKLVQPDAQGATTNIADGFKISVIIDL